MSRKFGEEAARLAGLAAQILGWQPAEFWNASPADLANSLRPPEDNSTGISRAELKSLLEGERHG